VPYDRPSLGGLSARRAAFDDLAYLAHVREVNTGAKETLSFLADGWFSVVLANRFPLPDKSPVLALENRAYLVSLEGAQDYLPGSAKPAANKPVRLAVLSSWSFHCCGAFAFKASMNQLKVQLLRVPRQADGAAGARRLRKNRSTTPGIWATRP
jgi:hypothetical protein